MIFLFFLVAGCTPRYVAPLSGTYSQAQFTELSRGYRKTINTESGERIRFYKMKIQDDTVYFRRKRGSETTKTILLSRVSTIDLASGGIPAIIPDILAGIVMGVGLAHLLDSQPGAQIPSFAYILPLIGAVMGGTVGYNTDRTKIYSGSYSIVHNGMTYRLKPERIPHSHRHPSVILDN